MEDNLETYRVIYNPESAGTIYGISPVDEPATGREDWILMSKQSELELVQFSEEKEKRMVYGIVLIPNQLVLRKNPKTGKLFNLMFEAEVIQKYSQDFFKNGYQSNAWENHEEGKKIEGFDYVESWLITDPNNDKANALGFKDLSEDMWVVGAHVTNDETWSKIKNKELNGFSIDSFVAWEKIEMSMINNNEPKKQKMNLNLFKMFSNVLVGFAKTGKVNLASVDVEDGTLIADSFELDAIVYLGEEIYADKEFEFEGNIIKTDAEGKIISIEPMEPAETDAAEEDSAPASGDTASGETKELLSVEGPSAYIELPVGVHTIDGKVYTVVETVDNEGLDNEWRYNIIESIVPIEGEAPAADPAETTNEMSIQLSAALKAKEELEAKVKELSKQPAGVKLSATVVETPRHKETTMQALNRIASSKN